MPQSKGRSKKRRSGYQLEADRKKPKAKSSPRFFGPLMLFIMGVGVAIIVWNYTRGDQASPYTMALGLGLIAVGFFGVTFWR